MTYTEVWNEAYGVFWGKGTQALKDYIKEKTDDGTLGVGDAAMLFEDMVLTAEM